MDNNKQKTLQVKATYLSETKRFELPVIQYNILLEELRSRFQHFGRIEYIDDQEDPVILSTDEELRLAHQISGDILRLVISKEIGINNYLDRLYCVKWFKGQDRETQEKYEAALAKLFCMGYKTWKKNLNLLRINNCDVDKTVTSLQQFLKKREDRKSSTRRPKRVREEKPPKPPKQAKRAKLQPEKEQNREHRERGKNAYMNDFNEWPSEITILFIDGNNLMYLTDGLRKLTLQHNINLAQKVLITIAEALSNTILLETFVIFDNSKTDFVPIHLENGSKVITQSAKGVSYSTSDAMIINWAKENPGKTSSTLVVTSDRALAGQLKLAGVSLAKPSSLLKFVAKLVSGDQDIDFKVWVDAMIGKVTSSTEDE